MNKALSREIDIAMSHRLAEVRAKRHEEEERALRRRRRFIAVELMGFGAFCFLILVILVWEIWLPPIMLAMLGG
jgi:fatty acid desaturase